MSTTFELSKRLFELRPGWDNTGRVYSYAGEMVDEGVAVEYPGICCPEYNLEYLLERLPTDDSHRWYLQRWNNIDYAATYQDILSSNLDEQTICHAPTPLEAVLKLTIALIEAGLMPEGGKS